MSSMTMRPITPACLPRITDPKPLSVTNAWPGHHSCRKAAMWPIAWIGMKALRSFTVRPKLPAALAPLHELAMNLRWSWDDRTRDLFRWVDPDQWEVTGHDPVRLLGLVRRERL